MIAFWNPIGFAADDDGVAFMRLQQTGPEHGRVARLTTIGYITPRLGAKWSGHMFPFKGITFVSVPTDMKALIAVPAFGWAQSIADTAFCEVPLDQGPGTKAVKRGPSAEIADGRLVMMAIIGMLLQDGLARSACARLGQLRGLAVTRLREQDGGTAIRGLQESIWLLQ